ncbi:MAG: hypothetical protein U9N13_05640 [Euryarchaeota archaeon]|nr:hypothetical protein [Euryarchaeota archaeon]
MVLPEMCPLTKEKGCKREECYLYHVDWRTGEENCSIGYRYTHRVSGRSSEIQDTYAQDTRDRLSRKVSSIPDQKPPLSKENGDDDLGDEQVIQERVITADRNTTVIGSDVEKTDCKKEKKDIDKTMALDLPDDYEEKFWSE